MKRTGDLSRAALAMAAAFFISSVIAAPKKAADLYSQTNIWNIHLKFAAQQWADMEPRDGGGGFGPFGGGPRPGGGGPPGPAMMIAPLFIRDGDVDKNGQISKDEFSALGKKWFAAWDTNKSGKVGNDQLRDGLNALIMPPGGPGPMMGGRRGLQGREGQRNGIAANMEFEYVHADLEFEDKTFTNVAARYKGNGTFLQSRRSDKKPMKVDLNKFVKGQKIAGAATLNLHNNVTDPSWMNEVLAYQLYRDAGVPAPRTAYARVRITAPPEHKNEYFGLYTLVENVDTRFAEEFFKVEDGGIFKPVTSSLFSDLGDDWKEYNQTYDPKDASKADKERVIETCKFVNKADDKEFAAKIGDFIELDQFARYLAVTVWLTDIDGILGPGQNFYLFLHPKTRKFSFIAWDQDHSFGQMPMRGTQEERERLSIQRPWMGDNPFLERMFKVESFKKAYLGYLDQFSKTIFQPERIARQVDQLAPLLKAAIKEESPEKLAQFESAIAGKVSEGGGGFRPFGGSKPIKGFVPVRNDSVIAQLAGNEKGSELTGGPFGGGRRGGPGGFGPGMFLGGAFMTALDENKDRELTANEVSAVFSRWFGVWNKDNNDALSTEELQTGLGRDLPIGFPGGGPGFGPPRQ